MTSTLGSYQRRKDDWDLQRRLADKELDQIDQQIAAAGIRREIAQTELRNHNLQIDNTQAVDDYMHSKYTNQELYAWMLSQLGTLYFQSYQMAYDVAKRVERTFQYELSVTATSFIQFGYWDSLRKGLLAGEKLDYDLERMEMAYLDQNGREYELTKQVSLALLDPVALLKLIETGSCLIRLPEEIFDMDCPGHYMRRIKSVSLTIPCVVGPYTGVNCTLTLLSSSMRINSLLSPNYERNETAGSDPRFRDSFGAIESVVTSHGQNDSGLFELNFRDERYLPFEGLGAISQWSLQLSAALPQFDYETISDVIVSLKYTAREGGRDFADKATAHVQTKLPQMPLGETRTGLLKSFSLRRDFPNEWYKFLHPSDANTDQSLALDLPEQRFPLFTRGKALKVSKVDLIARINSDNDYTAVLSPPLAIGDTITLTKDSLFGTLHHGLKAMQATSIGPSTLKLKASSANDFRSVVPGEVDDIVLVLQYQF
jgi:hypothetical protein